VPPGRRLREGQRPAHGEVRLAETRPADPSGIPPQSRAASWFIPDRLLRVLVARETPVMEYSVDVLAQVAADDGPTAPVRVELEKGPKGWKYRRGPALVTTT
jgi:hypothetical protein